MSKFALVSTVTVLLTVVVGIVFAVFSIIRFIALWKLFKKAGVQPWRLLVPFMGYCYILELGGFHGLFCLLVLIPFFYIGGIIGWLMPVLLYRRFVGADQARAWKTLIPFYGAFLSLKIANDPACQYDGQRFVYKDQGGQVDMSMFTNQQQNFQQDWNNMQSQWHNNQQQRYTSPQQTPPVQTGQWDYTQTQPQGYSQQSPYNVDGTPQNFQFDDQTWTENDFRADQ